MATLTINVTSRAGNIKNTQAIIQNLFKIIPSVLNTYGQLAKAAAIGIAPFSSKQKQRSKRRDYTYLKPKGQGLRDGIFYRKTGDLSLTLGVRGEVKVIMQEYGYPYDTREIVGVGIDMYGGKQVGFAPYEPNPKNAPNYRGFPNSKIRKVGYLRAGLVSASKYFLYKNFDPDKLIGDIATQYPMVTKAEVLNYRAVVTQNLKIGISRFITDYAKGKIKSLSALPGAPANKKLIDNRVGIPLTSADMSAVESSLVDVEPISKFASKFGSVSISFDDLSIATEEFGKFNTVSLGGGFSFTGRPKESKRDFLI